MFFSNSFSVVFVTLSVFGNFVVQDAKAAEITNSDWWKHAVFYQIYPRSFKDNNNDGKGDLQGIISKLDHLKEAGVTAAWLSPIYVSPQVDQGYDISNFTAIDPDYGTMDDFQELITKAHENGIKIIMDFVPNHSSDKHEWFTKSANNETGFEDYYVWKDGVDGRPPNNWLSIFKNSAWTFNSIRNQYYLHQFAPAQPDLNYRSPGVVQKMKEVLTFWMDKGVDGFRMDAVPMLVEDDRFRNESRSNYPDAPSNSNGYLRHQYTQDQPETFSLIYDWRKHLDSCTQAVGGDARIMMTEAYTDIYNTMYYFGDGFRDGAHFTFNFLLITDLNRNSTARDLVSAVEKWVKSIPEKYTSNWVVGNHDNNRVATRFGPNNVDAYNILVALLPGIMVTYNGEEIGQEDGEVTYEQGQDPNACTSPKEDFTKVTRDVERTPFQWDNSTNAGFNAGKAPWLPVSAKYKETNLAAQKNPNVNSHFQIYKQLTQLRQQPAFKTRNLKIKAITDDVLVFSRSLSTDVSYLAILNIGAQNVTITIHRVEFSATDYLEIVIASVTSSRKKGDLISTKNVKLVPYESLVTVTTSLVPQTTAPASTGTPSTGSSEQITSSSPRTSSITSSTTSNTSTTVGNGATTHLVSLAVLATICSLSLDVVLQSLYF